MILRRLNQRKIDSHWRRVAPVAGALLCLAAFTLSGCRTTAPSAGTLPPATASIRSKLLSIPKSATNGPSVTLAWDLGGPMAVGSHIYMGTNSGLYFVTNDTGPATTWQFTGLTNGQTYFFAATDYDTNRLESAFSSEVRYTVPTPPPPPTNLTIISVTVQASADLQSWSNAAVLQAITFTNPPGAPEQFYRGLMAITRTNL